MGVPAFFRWLAHKYPLAVRDAVEQSDISGQGFVDASQLNPNGFEVDNLYLDMNGIIHPACHPEGKPAPQNESMMMVNICEYIDRVFSIARPRRLLYMAIDGVAPRAKMNQQRSRRFRAAKEMQDIEAAEAKARQMWLDRAGQNGKRPPSKKNHWDSNVITPGTPFMARVSRCLHRYIALRLQHHAAWKNLVVIFSDAKVPGEGEHKIMQFIRQQRMQPTGHYDSSLTHCIHGMDADLIMLALASHEPNFYILREIQVDARAAKNFICSHCGGSHRTNDCTSSGRDRHEGDDDEVKRLTRRAARRQAEDRPFEFVDIAILREYLQYEFRCDEGGGISHLSFGWSLERIIDDWVFLCIFVGNDFLPELPSLDIREGALEMLMKLYRRLLPSLGGYISKDGVINFSRVDILLSEVGEQEETTFKRRKKHEHSHRRKQMRLNSRNSRSKSVKIKDQENPFSRDSLSPSTPPKSPLPDLSLERDATDKEDEQKWNGVSTPKEDRHNFMLQMVAAKRTRTQTHPSVVNEMDHQAVKTQKTTFAGQNGEDQLWEQALHQALDQAKVEVPDSSSNLEIGEQGWKERYYNSKLDASRKNPEHAYIFRALKQHYAEGLQWVMLYYYQGCPSWSWFYPFHYAPLASDLVNIDECVLNFELGAPFAPIMQLLAVLPPRSAHCMPKSFAQLMQQGKSPLKEYYPADFQLDLNGKRFLLVVPRLRQHIPAIMFKLLRRYAWQAVALLPFIDEKRLDAAASRALETFNIEEKDRNSVGNDFIFASVDQDKSSELSNGANGRSMVRALLEMHGQREQWVSLPLPDSICSTERSARLIVGQMSCYPNQLLPALPNALPKSVSNSAPLTYPLQAQSSDIPLSLLPSQPNLLVVSARFHNASPKTHTSQLRLDAILPSRKLNDFDKQHIRFGFPKGGFKQREIEELRREKQREEFMKQIHSCHVKKPAGLKHDGDSASLKHASMFDVLKSSENGQFEDEVKHAGKTAPKASSSSKSNQKSKKKRKRAQQQKTKFRQMKQQPPKKSFVFKKN